MIEETTYQDYLGALLAGRRSECQAIVQSLLDGGIELKTLYSDLFHRSMYRVGELWEHNQITVAREHLATSITESLLNLVYPKLFAAERVGKTAIISCSANEFHQIGGKMVADLFELCGWHGHFLGADVSIPDLLARIDDEDPDILGLSLSILSHIDRLHRCIQAVRTNFPELNILVGGQAFTRGGWAMLEGHDRVQYVASLTDLENQIERIS